MPGSSVLQSESTQCRPEPRGPAGGARLNTTVRPHPSLGRPDHSTTIICVQPASQQQPITWLARATELHSASYSINPNNWGIQGIRSVSDAQMRQVFNGTRVHEHQFSFKSAQQHQMQIHIQVQIQEAQVQEAQKTALPTPSQTYGAYYTAEPQSHAQGQLRTAEPDSSAAAAPVQHPRYKPQNGSRQASAPRHTAKQSAMRPHCTPTLPTDTAAELGTAGLCRNNRQEDHIRTLGRPLTPK